MTVRVALVDDHQPFRERLRALLQRDARIAIVAEAGSGQEMLDIAQTVEVDVVLMDIKLPGMSGIECTRRLLAMRPGTRIIGLSAFADPHYVKAMLKAGAAGQFTKGDAGSETLVQAIHAASAERPMFGANIPRPFEETTMAPAALPAMAPNADASSLSGRELDVLRMIASGLTSDEIARVLAIDPSMVDVHCRNMTRKLRLGENQTLREYAKGWALREGSRDE